MALKTVVRGARRELPSKSIACDVAGVFRLFALAAIVLCTSGCGLLLQTAVGWNSRETTVKTENHAVRITSQPEGVEVVRRAPDGQETTLGTAPLTDQVPYQVELTTESPKVGALLIGGLLEGAATVALIVVGNNGSGTGGRLAAYMAGGLLGYLTIQELVVALIHGLSSDTVVGRKIAGGSTNYLYAGRKAGLPDGLAIVRVPEQTKAELVLEATTEAKPIELAKTPAENKPAAPLESSKWVVAVMRVEDLNADLKDRAIDPDLVDNLGDQMRVFVSQRGIKTIDPSAQDRVLKEQIETAKKESYKECYDDSCQIELGKALAASHILRARITRFGKRCVLNAELIDLRAEVTVSAASAQGDCEAEGFLSMSEAAANSLFQASK
jgi:hypothetical protein